jgi:hypothetical protein
MAELARHLFQLVLELLGIDKGTQFLWAAAGCLAALVAYLVRSRRRHGVVFSTTFLLLTLSLLVFLFTEDAALRTFAAVTFVTAGLIAFAWHFGRSRGGSVRP